MTNPNPNPNPTRHPVRRWSKAALDAATAASIAETEAASNSLRADPSHYAALADDLDRRWAGPRDLDRVRRHLAAHAPRGRVLLYPGGTHTEAVIGTLSALPETQIVGIIDQSATDGARRFGQPLVTPEAALGLSFDAVLLSHQEYELEFTEILRDLGYPADKIVPIYNHPAYRAATEDLPPDIAAQLPDGIETILLSFQTGPHQLLSDRELAAFFPPETTLRLFMGRPHLAGESPVYRTIDLKQSTRWLEQVVRRLNPRQAYVMTMFQYCSARWSPWLRRCLPGLRLYHELYDWLFTLPPAVLDRQFFINPAARKREILAEMAAIHLADAVIHKYGGPHWRAFDRSFYHKTIHIFPVVGTDATVQAPLPVRDAAIPRIVFAGGLTTQAIADTIAPEQQILGHAQALTAGGRVHLDIFNGLDRPPMPPAAYDSYRRACPAPPLHYHGAVPFDTMQRLLSDYDFGLLALNFDMPEIRHMDLVSLGNKFLSYVNRGLPVLASPDDLYTSLLVRHFGAGLITDRHDAERLIDRLITADRARLHRGVAALCRYCRAVNRRSMRRLSEIVATNRQGPGAPGSQNL